MEQEGQGYMNYSWCVWNSPKELGEETEGIGNQWWNQNHPDYGMG